MNVMSDKFIWRYKVLIHGNETRTGLCIHVDLACVDLHLKQALGPSIIMDIHGARTYKCPFKPHTYTCTYIRTATTSER